MLKERGFYKGINFGGWLSQCDYSQERMDNFITERDFEAVAGIGLDHVRIPVDYNIFENTDGTYKQDGFDRVEWAITTARKYDINVIIDLHKTAGFSFDDYSENEHGFFENEEYQERFYRLWEQLSARFGKYSDNVAFELLNEVTEPKFIDVWNKVSNECIRRIRVNAPDTIILVGSYWNNSPEAVPELAKPYDDKVVYNFHCYSPLEFTHQGAYWVESLANDKRLRFDECNITEEYFEKLFESAIKKAQQENTTLYCGEYGTIEFVTPEDTVKWYKTINAVFEKYGISRAAWSYKEMDFGLSDSRLSDVIDELVKYL